MVFRVAACGPAGSGKTNLLWRLHSQIPAVERGELVVRPVGADQIVSFECSAPDLVPTSEYRAKLHLVTIPGRIANADVWRRIMTDVDGIIFVADSQFERIGDNSDSLRSLAAMTGIGDVPLVFIYNKRDLPNCAPLEYLDYVLNNAQPRLARFEGVLTAGRGASEALSALSAVILKHAG